MSELASIAIGVGMLLAGGGAFGGFWLWARTNIMRLSRDFEKEKAESAGRTALLKAEIDNITARCAERSRFPEVLTQKLDAGIERLHGRIDELGKNMSIRDTETAKALGELKGTMKLIVKGMEE